MKIVMKALLPFALLVGLVAGAGAQQPTPTSSGSAASPGSAAPVAAPNPTPPAAAPAATNPSDVPAAAAPTPGATDPAAAPPAGAPPTAAQPTAAPPAATPPAGTPPPAGAPAAAGPPEAPTWWEAMVGDIKDHNYVYRGDYWLPPAASTTAEGPDKLFRAVLAMSIFFFVAITAAIVYLVVKYRHRPGHKPEPSPAHNDALEITWTVIPTIICVILFVYGWRSYLSNVTIPEPRPENVVYVEASKWSWSFRYHNGLTDNVLHAPRDQPMKLVMTSRDVLHSFFIPVFRIKQDVVPRRYSYVWFYATKPGVYRIYCTEYCGTDHSMMKTKVVVHEAGKYEQYLTDAYVKNASLTGVPLGMNVYEKKGCNTCHSVDGSPKIGPTWKGSYGTTISLEGGAKVAMDDAYIRNSILNPQAQLHAGFPPSMPITPLSPAQIEGVIAYIQSLK